jgi:hypothetical protein
VLGSASATGVNEIRKTAHVACGKYDRLLVRNRGGVRCAGRTVFHLRTNSVRAERLLPEREAARVALEIVQCGRPNAYRLVRIS